MDFDFHKKYAAYSIPQLLEIIDARDSYQPAAVQAAEDLLAAKDPAEVQQARDSLVAAPEAQAVLHKVQAGGAVSIFDEGLPEYNPVLQRRYWLVMIVALGVCDAYSIYELSGLLSQIDDYILYQRPVIPLLRLSMLMLSLVALVLVVRRHRIGWILTAGLMTYYAVITLMAVVFLIHLYSLYFFGFGVLRAAFFGIIVFLCWRPSVRSLFGIEKFTARCTLLVGILAAVVVYVVMMVEPMMRLR